MTTDSLAPGWRAIACPRCGGAFACGAGADRATPCFCVSAALGQARLAELRAKWSDCLCAACLATLAANPQVPA